MENPTKESPPPLSKEALKTPKRPRSGTPSAHPHSKTAAHEHATTLAYSLPPKQQEPHIFPHEIRQTVHTNSSDIDKPSSLHKHSHEAPLSRSMPPKSAGRHASLAQPRHQSPKPARSQTVHFQSISPPSPARTSSHTPILPHSPHSSTLPHGTTDIQLDDINSLRSTVRDLKHEIEKRKRGEETLQELNVQLRERLEEFKMQNSQNVDRAFHEVSQHRRELDALRREFKEKTFELERSKTKTAELERTLEILRDTPNRGDLIDQLRETREEKERLQEQLLTSQRNPLSSHSLFGVNVADGDPEEFLQTVAQIVASNPSAPSLDMDVVKFFAENPQAEHLRRRCAVSRQREQLRFAWRTWKRANVYAKRAKQLQPVRERSLMKQTFSKWRKELRSRMTIKTKMEHARLHHEHCLLRKTFNVWRSYRIQSLEMMHVMEHEADNMNRQLVLKHAYGAWKQWMEEYVYAFRQKVAAFRDYHYRRLLVNMFYRWKERYQQRLEMHRKENRVVEHYNYRVVKQTFQAWREYSRFKMHVQIQKQQADVFHDKLLMKKTLRILAKTAQNNQRTKSAHIRAYDFLFHSLRRKYFNALKENARQSKRRRQLQQKANHFVLKKYFSFWARHTRRTVRDRRIELVADELYQRRTKQMCHQLFFQWRQSALKKRRLSNILIHSEERLNQIKKKFFFSTWRTRYSQKLHSVISQMDQSVRHLQSESVSFSSTKKDFELHNLTLVQKLHDLSGDISKQKVTISDQNSQINRLETELNDAAMIEQSLRGEITSLREQNNDFRDEIDTLKTQLVRYADVSPESLESVLEKQNAQEQIAALKQSVSTKNREIDRLKSMLSTFEGGDSQQKHKLRDAFDMIAQLRSALEEKDEEILNFKTHMEQNNTLVHDWRRRVEKEEHETLKKNETIRSLNQKLRDAKERSKMYNDSARDKDEEIEKMKFEMDLLASSQDVDERDGSERQHEDEENEEHGATSEDAADKSIPTPNRAGAVSSPAVRFDDDQELRDTILAQSMPARFQQPRRQRSSSDEDDNLQSPSRDASQLPSKLLSPYSSISSFPAATSRRVPDTTVYSATESTQMETSGDEHDDYDDEIKKLTSSIMSGLDRD
uniref:Sfi1 spindle body domain-containing protein n=1 Tax=Percolomonas cosmopolitus TaxID=63605 RepID=A0A7S1PHC0_9EUKA